MREILFRAKLLFNGMWVYGCFVNSDFNGYEQIVSSADGAMYDIVSETLGQYTGLGDKNGRKIFDGDIVRVLLSWDGDDVMDIGRVFYSEELCGFYRTSKVFGDGCPSMTYTDEYEVIGNIYDNPKLIGEKTND